MYILERLDYEDGTYDSIRYVTRVEKLIKIETKRIKVDEKRLYNMEDIWSLYINTIFSISMMG